MKKIFLTTVLLMIIQLVMTAQVTLQPAIPAVGLIQKNQLWNVLVINGTNKQYDCRLEMVLRDRITGQEVMTATTGQFMMMPGSKQLNINVLAPIQYNYFVTGIDSKMQGLLPAGSYNVCYALSSTAIKESNLAEECVQFDTEPLSPPMLIYPPDSAVLDITPTQFSWIPPTPDGMFDRLQYDVIITPIMDGQKAEQAIQENVPFYNDGNHFTNMLNYPSSSMAFEKDKWYAWQVTARDDRNYAGKSETWVFKVNTNNLFEDSSQLGYVLFDNIDAKQNIYYLKDNNLRLKYYSTYKGDTSVIRFRNSQSVIIKETKEKIVYGDNLLNFKLDQGFQKGQLYTIELIDEKGRLQKAPFIILD